MAELAHSFNDSAAYERFIGRWGRAAGAIFLDWVAPRTNAFWLDVGCGTGIFTELILDTRSPARVIGIDQAEARIDYASKKPVAQRASFRIGDAQALPFEDSTFDVVASALVMNFIPDSPRALSEMRRVARPGGVVAGYVWDFKNELSPSGPFRLGLRQVITEMLELPGTDDSVLGALSALFERAGGFAEIATKSIDVTVQFPDFDAFWAAQTPSYSPTTKMIAEMTKGDRARAIEAIRSQLPTNRSGRIEYLARANAIKACVLG